jgi:hypothetical protein
VKCGQAAEQSQISMHCVTECTVLVSFSTNTSYGCPIFLAPKPVGLVKIIIIIIIIIITFMQGMYNYIPKTNHVSWVHSVAAVT